MTLAVDQAIGYYRRNDNPERALVDAYVSMYTLTDTRLPRNERSILAMTLARNAILGNIRPMPMTPAMAERVRELLKDETLTFPEMATRLGLHIDQVLAVKQKRSGWIQESIKKR